MTRKSAFLLMVTVFSTIYIARSQGYDKKGQSDLDRLISLRSELFGKWADYNKENNSFWGGKSKKDLLNIINTQKAIIDVDNNIIDAIKNAKSKKDLQTADRNNELSGQISFYSSKIEKLNNIAESRKNRILALEKDMKTLERRADKLMTFLLISAGILILCLFYIFYNRKKRVTKKRKKR